MRSLRYTPGGKVRAGMFFVRAAQIPAAGQKYNGRTGSNTNVKAVVWQYVSVLVWIVGIVSEHVCQRSML
jgi:hypothetical protein